MTIILEKPVTLIGIHGKAGSGKDTVADYLQSKLTDAYKHPFALFLKVACVDLFAIDFDDFNNPGKKEVIQQPWGKSPREILQYVGTEMFRAYDPDFWVKRLAWHIDDKLEMLENWAPYEEGDTIIIPDVRFQNEVEFITANRGKLIHINRPDLNPLSTGIKGHASEAGVELPLTTHIFQNDSTKEKLYERVDQFINTQIMSF